MDGTNIPMEDIAKKKSRYWKMSNTLDSLEVDVGVSWL
jgi:hypothetical protein